MTIQGNIGQFENLLDTVNARSDIQITAFDVSPGTSSASSSGSKNKVANLRAGTNTVSVTFNVYMVDKGAAAANTAE